MNRLTAAPSRTRRRWLLALLAAIAAVASTVMVTANAATTDHPPVGVWGHLQQFGDGIQATGWALDPDTHAPIDVDVWVDGHNTRSVAGFTNTYVAAKYKPTFGVLHGFVVRVPEAAGTHTVCVHAVNSTLKGYTQLGCKSITLNYNPFGAINSAEQSPGHLTVTGWSIDPDDQLTPRTVTLIVDGTTVATTTANLPRPDIAKAQPGAGPDHGFTFTVPITEGKHTICARAKNTNLGVDTTFACTAMTINFSPVGAITGLIQIPGGFRVSGWSSDPDTSDPVQVIVSVDGKSYAATLASAAATGHAGHGFAASYLLPGTKIVAGTHTVCVTGINLGAYGKNTVVACRTITLNFNPKAGVNSLTQQTPGFHFTGWATDPDTTAAISAKVYVDGTYVTTVDADGTGGTHPGHEFAVTLPLGNGAHTVCVIGVNVDYGSGNSAPSCSNVTLDFNPYGQLQSATRSADGKTIRAVGWAIDPDTTASIHVTGTADGTGATTVPADIVRADIAKAHPGTGPAHGFSVVLPVNPNEHKICVTALNVDGGNANTALGCLIVDAIHPVAPSVPQTVSVLAGYGGATVSWTAPASDGGAPWSGYTVTSVPGGVTAQVGAGALSATVLGLKPKTSYTFTVVATNVAGNSLAATTLAAVTQAAPPAQTSPAPISTSRYTRNIVAATASDLATMRAEGAADATANPSGHGYLILLDIGGQDETDHGVVLSAGVRFVSYVNLVKDLDSYVDGYASKQRPSAPITIALGTNNDMDVSTSSGADWAKAIVNPVVAYAAKYPGVTIAGANDIEPGFRGTYAQSKAWLLGYLAATKAPFVFNGSADGCSWTQPGRGCNNGWTMAGLDYLSGGAAPVRIIDLPQVYNDTMAAQWKYISLTGVDAGLPKIDFGGALTEWTACQQAGSCGSLTGNSAWTQVWSQLQSVPALKVASLPYSTDLRIDS